MISNVYNVFIRKNTQELRDALEELGYVTGWSYTNNTPCLVTNFGRMHGTYSHDFKTVRVIYKALECFDNEELFLAAAAVNIDNCFKNVYIKILEDYQVIPAGTIVKNTTNTIPEGIKYHVLTFDELKEYFHVNIRGTKTLTGEQQDA